MLSLTPLAVFRLETRQSYAIPADDDELVAFRTGAPRPERSVRTSAWLRRIAAQTVTRQVYWSRLRVIDYPLSEYTRFELVAFVESRAAGEEIRLVESSVGVDDFWLVDGGTEHAVGVLMHYDDAGHLQGREQVVDPNALAGLRTVRDRAWPSGCAAERVAGIAWPADPRPRRDRLRTELARLRVQAGLSGQKLGASLGSGRTVKQATISRIGTEQLHPPGLHRRTDSGDSRVR